MVLTETGLAKVFQRVKSFVASQLNSKASAIHTHTASDITDLPNGITVDSTLDGTSSNAIANDAVKNALDGKSDIGHTHTKSEITDFPTLATVATSGSYDDLSDKPTIPTYSAGSNLSLSDTTFNVSSTPSFTSITIGDYTITID